MIRITLPFPPTTNHAYPSGRSGRRYLSKEGKAYTDECWLAVYQQLGAAIALKPLSGSLSVEIVAHAPLSLGKRKWDLGNREKMPLDALVKTGVIEDDSLIDDLRIRRGEPRADGELEVTITELVAVPTLRSVA